MMDTPLDQESADNAPLIVGIGASAGGLKSIEVLFDNTPSDTDSAFVIIQHLSPNHKTLMPEILGRHTSMPVILASEEMELRSNHVYVIPPGKELRCVGLTLIISDLPNGWHRPVDTFFESLAQNEGVPSVGVILSGTGSDGAAGVSAIHRAGGLTISESEESAEFDGMPISAVRTGCVDLVLTPAEIARAICEYRAQLTSSEATIAAAEVTPLQQIFSLLDERYGIRFDQYKPRTIARRLERRQKLCGFATVADYADNLGSDASELDELFHDLLIGVTKFFRDELAFQALEQQILADLKDFPVDATYRIWVAGCATGEEAYSIAMMVLDVMEQLGRHPSLKVFATDIHQRSLQRAARGEFNKEAMEFVSLTRQRKYFDRYSDERFRVNAKLRQFLVFAGHNMIRDAPFTNIQLVACRNVLIYFRDQTQYAALASFHFALAKKGLLFLGSSESLSQIASEFETVDSKWRLFRKLRDRRDLLSDTSRFRKASSTYGNVNLVNSDRRHPLAVDSLLEVYDAVIQTQFSIGLLLDHHQNVVHAIGDVASILKGASGRISGKIGDFLVAPARTTVAAALIRAQKEPNTRFVVEQIQPQPESDQRFSVSVMAFHDLSDSNLGWIVQFEPSDKPRTRTVRVQHDPDSAYELLESELQFTRESLSASVEELEASNEELQATNQEMVASNEELQSTNEELHSVNEELHSVNAELHRKIEQLEIATNDLETLLISSDIGTIFLDRDLRVRKFTSAVKRHFNLMPHDIGRALTDFSNRLGLNKLPQLLQDVIATGKVYSGSCVDEYGEAAFIKIVPYETGQEISGAVLTVLSQASPPRELNTYAYGQLGTWDWPDINDDVMWWSPTCYQLMGLEPSSPSTFSRWRSLIHPSDLKHLEGIGTTTCRFIERGQLRLRMRCADNSYRSFEFRNICRLADDGSVRAMAGTVSNATVLDAHEPKGSRVSQNTGRGAQLTDDLTTELLRPIQQIRDSVERLRAIETEVPMKECVAIEQRIGEIEERLSHLTDTAASDLATSERTDFDSNAPSAGQLETAQDASSGKQTAR